MRPSGGVRLRLWVRRVACRFRLRLSLPVSCCPSGGVWLRLCLRLCRVGSRFRAASRSRFRFRASVGWRLVSAGSLSLAVVLSPPSAGLLLSSETRRLQLARRSRLQNTEFCIIVPLRSTITSPCRGTKHAFCIIATGSSVDVESASPRLRHPRRGFLRFCSRRLFALVADRWRSRSAERWRIYRPTTDLRLRTGAPTSRSRSALRLWSTVSLGA